MMWLNLTNANASLSSHAIRNSNAASVPSASFLRKQSCTYLGMIARDITRPDYTFAYNNGITLRDDTLCMVLTAPLILVELVTSIRNVGYCSLTKSIYSYTVYIILFRQFMGCVIGRIYMALRSYCVLDILLPSIIIIVQDYSHARNTYKCL